MVNSRLGPAAPAAGGQPAISGVALEGPTTLAITSLERSQNAVVAHGAGDDSGQTMAVTRTSLRNRQLDVETGAADISDRGSDESATEAALAVGSPAPASLAAEKRAAEIAPGGGRGAARDAAGGGSDRQIATDAVAQRAEAASAAPGLATPGGGTQSPARATRGPQVVANTGATIVEIAGASPSSGAKSDQPRSSLGDQVASTAGGIVAPLQSGPVGAIVAELPAVAANLGSPGAGQASLARSPAEADGPMIRDLSNQGGPARCAIFNDLPAVTSTVAAIDVDSGYTASNLESADAGLVAGSLEAGRLEHSSAAALPVDIQAAEGPGGLGEQTTVDVGVNSRRAREESLTVKLEGARFTRQQVGGLPDFNTAAVVAAEPFRRRGTRGATAGGEGEGSGPKTEEAVELGLVFLSRCQEDDGSWRLDRFAGLDGLPQMASDTAATALVLLAFQGAGYNHREHRYADVIKCAIEYLLENQDEDGSLFVPSDDYSNQFVKFYSHSIAALALSEAYGMTQDPELRGPAQKSLDYIVATQNEDRGGWRYAAGRGADTSVTGWMMMALKSGELANLKVDKKTYANIQGWLDRAQASSDQPYLYCYNPYASSDDAEQGGGTRPTRTMTSVGLLMRLYLGWRRDTRNLELGAQYLLQRPPAIGTVSAPSAIPITGTTPPRSCFIWVASIGKHGENACIRCWSTRRFARGNWPAAGIRGPRSPTAGPPRRDGCT